MKRNPVSEIRTFSRNGVCLCVCVCVCVCVFVCVCVCLCDFSVCMIFHIKIALHVFNQLPLCLHLFWHCMPTYIHTYIHTYITGAYIALSNNMIKALYNEHIIIIINYINIYSA